MKTGIVILNYNDYETTKFMLNQIKDYNELDNIIVVDNLSKDSSYEKLKEYENDKIKIIQSTENKGYSNGNNYGIKYLIENYNTDYIIISNPDILIKNDDIKKLKQTLNKNNNIDLIAPVVHEHNSVTRGWKLPSYIDELLSNINFVHKYAHKRLLYSEKDYTEKLTKVDVVSGCFFMIRKSSFEKINYFDPNTFLYYEENIIGKKLKENNMNTYILNDVEIVHNLSVSVDKNVNKIKKYKILKQSQKYYEKEYNKLNIFGMILLRFLYYISLLIAYIVYFIRKIWR